MHRSKIAIVGEHRSYTFDQLLRRVREMAVYLQDQGLGPGDHLILGIPPAPEFYALFYAAATLGMTTVPVSPSGKLPSTIRALNSITIAGSKSFIAAARAGEIHPRCIIPCEIEQGLSIPRPKRRFVRQKTMRQEAVLASSSSGTTGEPVIFTRSAEALYRRARLGGIAWGIDADDTMLSTGPFTSGANANYHLVLPIVQGTKIVVLANFQRRKAVDSISRERVTVLFAVPIIFDVLARLPAAYSLDFSSLRRCISGGTHLPPDIYKRFYRRFGRRIAQGYGGVHFAPAFTVNRRSIPGAVGQKNGMFSVAIVGARGKEVRVGGIGEIAFDVTKVKYKWAKRILEHNIHRRGKYVCTGDLGRLDKHGNLFVVGRKSALIKVGANRVAAAEVEDVLRSHPHVHDAVVFPVRAGRADEMVGAIVLRNGRLTAKELIDYCALQLDTYKCPHTITFRKSLRRNSHGKVIRYIYDHDRENRK